MNLTTPDTIDVRTLPPAQRHPLIFQTFDRLEKGKSFEIVAPHDPQHLRMQFEQIRAGTFDWEPLQTGPVDWRIRITRR